MFLPSRKVHTHVKQQIQLYFRIFQPQNVTACISIIKPHLLTTIHLLAPAIHFFHAPPQKAQSPIQWVPGLFPRGKSGRSVKLITHLHLVPTLRMRGTIPPLPTRLHDMVLSYAQRLYLLYFKGKTRAKNVYLASSAFK